LGVSGDLGVIYHRRNHDMLNINDREQIDWREGMTVTDLLDILGYDFAMITVTINQQLILEEDYSTYLIPDQAKINIFHLAHGG
jgi:thiamine biosynthesis protein ThiS